MLRQMLCLQETGTPCIHRVRAMHTSCQGHAQLPYCRYHAQQLEAQLLRERKEHRAEMQEVMTVAEQSQVSGATGRRCSGATGRGWERRGVETRGVWREGGALEGMWVK